MRVRRQTIGAGCGREKTRNIILFIYSKRAGLVFLMSSRDVDDDGRENVFF